MSHCPSDPFKRRPSNCLIVLYVCAITRDICCIFIVFFFLWQSVRSSPVFSPFFMTSLQLLWVLSVPLEFQVLFLYLFVFGLDLLLRFLNKFKLVGGGGLASNWTSLIRNCSQRIWKRRCCCYAAPYSCGGPHGICWFQPDKCDY